AKLSAQASGGRARGGNLGSLRENYRGGAPASTASAGFARFALLVYLRPSGPSPLVEANLARSRGAAGYSDYRSPYACYSRFSSGWFSLKRMPFDVFETVYGALYDAGVQSRLAPLGGILMWGVDDDRLQAATVA